ncbi:MAG: ATP-binding cassette domain-containing protein [Clostridium sp.]|nr:ATP-binding cassette domain-containing protein [Clostridium sp.]
MKLIIDKVCKSFSKNIVLKDASFKFEKGKIYGLLGRNGAGKTTLFNCISNELVIEDGKIYIESSEGKEEVDDENIGYCYSEPILPEFLTGYEFLKFYIDINRNKIKNLLSIEEYLEIVEFKIEDSL